MALSFASVQKAYAVFEVIKEQYIPDLKIPSFPQDMVEWSEEEKKNPPANTVIGWGKKYDDGWENIFFLVENPSEELKEMFIELASVVPNSTLNSEYEQNSKFWILGWF